MKLLLSLLLLANVAVAAPPNEKPSPEELTKDSDTVVILRVESIQRRMGYGASAILIGTNWYIVRGRVVTVLQGEISSESEVIDVIFRTNENAAVLGYVTDPQRRIGAVSEFLVKSPLANGKLDSKSVEILAFLKDWKHEREKPEGPPMFVPTTGLEHAEQSFRILRTAVFRVPKKK